VTVPVTGAVLNSTEVSADTSEVESWAAM
jgi:hypothetical protein